MRENKLQNTEITATPYGFSHANIPAGSVENRELNGNKLRIGRLSQIAYYHLRGNKPWQGEFHINPQQVSETRLIYLLQGERLQFQCQEQHGELHSGQAARIFIPDGTAQQIRWFAQGGVEILVATVSEADLTTWFPNDSLTRHPDPTVLAFNLDQASVIRQFLNHEKPEYLNKVFRQIKLAELFVLFFEQAHLVDQPNPQQTLHPKEEDRMQQVRDLLYHCPAASYSLPGLARQFGTNEASLKKNFKVVFGTTIFKYLTARRMELAKELLAANELKISAIAQEVGYKHASHFTAAFRKYYGVLPKKMRT